MKKNSTKVSCSALIFLHCEGQVFPMTCLQNNISLSYSLSRKHAPLLLLSCPDPKQHKVVWLMLSVTPETKQNWRLPPQLVLGTIHNVCRESLQSSFLSSHQTNLKYWATGRENPSKTGSVLHRKFLFKEGFLLIAASDVLVMPIGMSVAEWHTRVFHTMLRNGND